MVNHLHLRGLEETQEHLRSSPVDWFYRVYLRRVPDDFPLIYRACVTLWDESIDMQNSSAYPERRFTLPLFIRRVVPFSSAMSRHRDISQARKEKKDAREAQTLWHLATPGDGTDRVRVVAPGTRNPGISA